jgi:hypothetical protein
MKHLADRDQLMARLSKFSQNRWQRFHGPTVPFVEQRDRSGDTCVPVVERGRYVR